MRYEVMLHLVDLAKWSASVAQLMCVSWCRQEQDGVVEVGPDFVYRTGISCEGPHQDHNVPSGSN